MHQLSSTFEYQMTHVSNAVHALIEEAILRAVASWQAALEDVCIPLLKALVSNLQSLIYNAPPGANSLLAFLVSLRPQPYWPAMAPRSIWKLLIIY